MTRIATVAALLLLAGCGTTGLTGDHDRTSYIMVSQGSTGGVYGLFSGKVHYCKAVAHKLDGVEFAGDVVVKDGACTVSLSAQDGGR